MTTLRYPSIDTPHSAERCLNCGCRYENHRAGDSHCPAVDQFPKWPAAVKDETRAEAIFDSRLAKHWAKRKTKFTR